MKKLIISMFVSCVVLGVSCGRTTSDGVPAKMVEDTMSMVAVTRTTSTPVASHDVVEDDDSLQLAICEKVLDGCVNAEILDAKGVRYYHRLRKMHSVLRYIELITECEREEMFYDTVGESDAWLDYVDYVLKPRGFED